MGDPCPPYGTSQAINQTVQPCIMSIIVVFFFMLLELEGFVVKIRELWFLVLQSNLLGSWLLTWPIFTNIPSRTWILGS